MSNCQIVTQSSFAILHSNQQFMGTSHSYPWEYLISLILFLILAFCGCAKVSLCEFNFNFSDE